MATKHYGRDHPAYPMLVKQCEDIEDDLYRLIGDHILIHPEIDVIEICLDCE